MNIAHTGWTRRSCCRDGSGPPRPEAQSGMRKTAGSFLEPATMFVTKVSKTSLNEFYDTSRPSERWRLMVLKHRNGKSRRQENVELISTINRSFKHHPEVHGFRIKEVRKGYITARAVGKSSHDAVLDLKQRSIEALGHQIPCGKA